MISLRKWDFKEVHGTVFQIYWEIEVDYPLGKRKE